MSSRLASSASALAASRTWPTDPGAPFMSARCIVWIESITQTFGFSASIVARMVSSELSASALTSRAAAPRRSARKRTCAVDSSPET